MFEWWSFALAAICAGALMPAVIRARAAHHDQPGAVQNVHVVPTSRLGGMITFVAFLVTVVVADRFGAVALAAAVPLALCALPVVLVGMLEDVTHRVRPRYRMLAAVISAAFASVYAGGVVPRLDLPLIDGLLRQTWFVLPLTWFMVAGACNAINLIDGAHGLAGGTALIMFAGIALAAGWSGDVQTLAEALTMIGALIGFLAWNYPRGRVFLGDAGAYFIGFMYAELAIRLITRNSGISAWYVIMLAGYPIVDTLFSMYRRGVLRGRKLMSPDALHLHSLIFRRVAMPLARRTPERRAGDRRSALPESAAPVPNERRRGDRRRHDAQLQRANALVAPRLWLHSGLCFALAVLFHDNTPALLACLFAYAALYVYRYRALVRFGRRRAGRADATDILKKGAEVAKPDDHAATANRQFLS